MYKFSLFILCLTLAGGVLCALTWMSLAGDVPSSGQQKEGRSEFEARFQAWKEYISRVEVMVSSRMGARTDCPQFRDMVALGPSSLPMLIEKLEAAGEDRIVQFCLLEAVSKITKKRFRSSEEVVRWLSTRTEIPSIFEKAYMRWDGLKREAKGVVLLWADETVYDESAKVIKQQQKKTPLGEVYQEMRDLGIAILPLIIEKLKAKDYDLLPLLGDLTDGQGITTMGSLEQRVRFTLDWWEANQGKWLLPPVDDKRGEPTKK